MTNSLSLKQCHFVGQSSILFPKYIYESFQGLYNPDRIRFLSLIRGSYSYGEGTGLHPGMRTAAAPLATRSNDAQRRHAFFPFKQYFKCKVKNVSQMFIRPEKICQKYLVKRILLCFEKWHCLSDSEFDIFRSGFCRIIFSQYFQIFELACKNSYET